MVKPHPRTEPKVGYYANDKNKPIKIVEIKI